MEALLESTFPWPKLLDLIKWGGNSAGQAKGPSKLPNQQVRVVLLQGHLPKNATAVDVAKLWKEVKRNLTFIHIPRAGGSALESVRYVAEREASHANSRAIGEASPVPMWGVHDTSHQHGLAAIPNASVRASCYRQHHPANLNLNAFANSDTFCVVRDPVKRIISQFGFMQAFYGKGAANCNAETLNNYLEKTLHSISANPYMEDCHLLPQAAFVYAWDPALGRVDLSKGRACSHVLRFENLSNEFNTLMEQYSYPIRLSTRGQGGFGSPKGCDALTEKNVTGTHIDLIKKAYAVDYDLIKSLRSA
jgi:hypothetical protein